MVNLIIIVEIIKNIVEIDGNQTQLHVFLGITSQWILTPCFFNSSCTILISISIVVLLCLRETAAATPAPCPVTVQAIILRIAAWEVLSPATHLPATNRF